MVRVRHAAIALLALLATSRVHAQTPTQAGTPTGSLTDLLLKQAQTALDGFDRVNAEKFARQVLEQMTTSTMAQKQRARVILANVYYPEEAPNARRRPLALAVLKDAVRENIDLTLDRTLTWAGIDSILVEAKATTFGMAATPVSAQQEAIGPTGHVAFTVRANRPSIFRLSISGPQATTVVADSTGASEVTLQVPTMRDNRPIFTTAEYEVTITAMDKTTRDTTSAHFVASVTAPALTFATVPAAIDSSRILPERTKKYGWKGIIVGGLVAGSIYGFSNSMHADTALQNKVGPDSKGTGIAALAGVTIVVASFLDKGRSIPSAIASNQRLRDDLATAIRTAQAENANRIATYKTTFVVAPEGR